MKIDYVFKNPSLLKLALTHSSKSCNNYERLEFLGDSILDFVVGEYFFKNTDKKEGELTVLRSHFVSESYLCQIFDKIEIANDVMLGKSYKGEISKAVKCDVVEAIIGAIYLDSNIEIVKNFIKKSLKLDTFENIENNNYKSQLQEMVQATFKSKMQYKTEKFQDGFRSTFFLADDNVAEGFGNDKAAAEQDCAKNAINKLFKNNDTK